MPPSSFFRARSRRHINAVNLTDGLDGLATGCTVTAALAFAVLAYVAGNVKISSYLQIPFYPFTGELTVVCMALAGAGLGFLWFIAFPRAFSWGIPVLCHWRGAWSCRHLLQAGIVLLVVGGVFVMEALSVILQVMSFKLTGKRIFAMSPIHHHFELKGWKENTVIVRFWILSVNVCRAWSRHPEG